MKEVTRYENGKRKAIIYKKHEGAIIPKEYNFSVFFYYDGLPDYEWKRGSGGVPCDSCVTLEQAKRKAKYYVNKWQ